MRLPSVAFKPIDSSLIPQDVSKLPRAQKRIMELLKRGSDTSISSASRSWSLDFQLSPTRFSAAATSPNELSSVLFERMQLHPNVFDPAARPSGTGENVNLPAGLAFRSIGYKSEPLQGLSDLGIPFDEGLGIIPNDQYGRILDSSKRQTESLPVRHMPGMYCAGWVKRGPTGVIASTMNDAFATAEAIAEDWYSHALFIGAENSSGTPKDGWAGLKGEAEKRGCRRVGWQDWKIIDETERQMGKAKGKEREKFTRVEDMLAVLD